MCLRKFYGDNYFQCTTEALRKYGILAINVKPIVYNYVTGEKVIVKSAFIEYFRAYFSLQGPKSDEDAGDGVDAEELSGYEPEDSTITVCLIPSLL